MKVSIVQKQTSYSKLVINEHDSQIEQLLNRHDPTVGKLLSSHDAHQETVEELEQALEKLGLSVIYRGNLDGKIPDDTELVITVGGDGTLLTTSHQLTQGIPLLGINSAPSSSVGFFCGGQKGNIFSTIERVILGKLPTTNLARMRVELNGELLCARVLNDILFCHASPAATSKYILQIAKANGEFEEEEQRSSGMWIGPAAGSTAAQRSAGGKVLPLDSRNIQYVVREPYCPIGEQLRFSVGLLEDGGTLTIRSKMQDSRIYIDGDRLEHHITIGDVLEMKVSEDSLTVLGLAGKPRQ